MPEESEEEEVGEEREWSLREDISEPPTGQ